jgi:hypothetical protein
MLGERADARRQLPALRGNRRNLGYRDSLAHRGDQRPPGVNPNHSIVLAHQKRDILRNLVRPQHRHKRESGKYQERRQSRNIGSDSRVPFYCLNRRKSHGGLHQPRVARAALSGPRWNRASLPESTAGWSHIRWTLSASARRLHAQAVPTPPRLPSLRWTSVCAE